MADNTLRIAINADIRGLNQNLSKAQGRLKAFSSRVSDVGKTLTTRLTLPLGVAGGVALKSAANFEKLKTQLNVLTGSAENGSKAFERLVKFSAGTPFQLNELVKANNTLMGFGVSAEDAYNHLQMIGDISAVSGGDLQGISVAFGQVAAAGRLMGQDLLQLINNGVPIIDMLSSSMGVAKSEIKDLVSEGAVTFPVLVKAFQEATSEGGKFEGGMAKLSQTISGVASTVKDNLNIAFAELGSEIFKALDVKNLAKEFIVFIQNLTNRFRELQPQTKKAIIVITGLVAAVGPLLVVLGTMSSGIGLVASGFAAAIPIIGKVASAFKGLTTVMLANPISVIAAGIVALGAAFVEVLHRINPIVSRLQTFYNLIKSGGNPTTFAALQALTMAENFKKQEEETSKAADAIEDYRKEIDRLNKSNSKQVKDDDSSKLTRIKASTVSEISLTTKKGEGAGYAKKGAGGDIAVGLQSFDVADPQVNTDNMAVALSRVGESAKNAKQRMEELANTVGNQVSGSFKDLSQAIVGSLNLGEGALGSFAGVFISTALDMVGAAAATAAANAIAGASAGSFAAGPLAPIVLPALIAGGLALVKSAFSSNVPAFANGGIVSGPTLGLMGEYTGSKSNPEVIAPLDKLKGMIGQQPANVNVGGQFRIQGQDLVVALQRADRNRSRIK